MLAIELLAPPPEGEAGLCCVTGRLCADAIPMRQSKAFGKNFSAWHLLAAPDSGMVSKAVADALCDRYLNWKSWVALPGSVLKGGREVIRDLVAATPACSWGAYACVSMRRPAGLLTRANEPGGPGLIQFDLGAAEIDATRNVYALVLGANEAGFSRGELDARDLRPAKRTAEQFRAWSAFLAATEPFARATEYRLAVWMLPAAKKEAPE